MVTKNGITFMIMMFVGAIIALSIMPDIANQVNLETNTFPSTNITTTVPAVNGTVDLTGRELLTQIEIYNSTNTSSAIIVGLALQTGVGTDGLLSVQLFANDTASGIEGQGVNVSYTYNPDGYVGTGNVAVTTLIIIFAALAILIFVIVTLFESPFRELFKT